MPHRSPLRFAPLLAALVFATSVQGAPPRRAATPPTQTRVTGCFSDLAYIPEAGDVAGTEVFILYGGNQYWALLQLAEGWPGEPSLVEATVSGQSVAFPFPAYGEQAAFSGRFTPFGLEGTVTTPEGPHPLRLARRRSYWQAP